MAGFEGFAKFVRKKIAKKKLQAKGAPDARYRKKHAASGEQVKLSQEQKMQKMVEEARAARRKKD